MDVKEEEKYETFVEDTKKDDSKENVKKLASVMRPALIFEYLFGIFRFRLSNGEIIPVSLQMKIGSLLITSTYVCVFFIFLKIPAALTGTGKVVDIVEEIPSIIVLIQYFTSAIRTTFLLNEQNIQIVKTLADLDRRLHVISNTEFYKRIHKVTKIIMIVIISIHVLFGGIDLLTSKAITIDEVIVFPVYLEQSLEIGVFCLMIVALNRRLSLINSYLKKFITEKDNTVSSIFIVNAKKGVPEEFNLIGRPSSDNMKIRDLAVAYDIIGQACGLVNDVFIFQIFMTLVATFSYIVLTIWSSLYSYKQGADSGIALATIIIWSIVNIFIVACMSLTCEKLLLTRTDTKILVNKLIMDYKLPNFMRLQAKAFMELIEAWPLRIFIYDMFAVDITLMLKYISVATTYLIVIIQISHFVYQCETCLYYLFRLECIHGPYKKPWVENLNSVSEL